MTASSTSPSASGAASASPTRRRGEPLYVVRLDAARRAWWSARSAALAIAGMSLREVNWLGAAPAAGEGLGVAVKVRSTAPAVAATVLAAGEGARVAFDEPQYGVAPGPGLRLLRRRPRARRRLDRRGGGGCCGVRERWGLRVPGESPTDHG